MTAAPNKMLSKERRIKKEDFEKIMKKGKGAHSPFLSLKYLPASFVEKGPEGEKSHFAFVISGKVAKRAVERNLFKRRCRHIAKKHLNSIKGGFSYIFFAKSGVTSLSFKDLEKEFLILMTSAKMIYDSGFMIYE